MIEGLLYSFLELLAGCGGSVLGFYVMSKVL